MNCFASRDGVWVEIPCPSDVQAKVLGMRGLGDVVERAVKPVARALNLDCLDKATGALKPTSRCAKRRDAMNRAFPFPGRRPQNNQVAST